MFSKQLFVLLLQITLKTIIWFYVLMMLYRLSKFDYTLPSFIADSILFVGVLFANRLSYSDFTNNNE